jgi:hypothetical protein
MQAARLSLGNYNARLYNYFFSTIGSAIGSANGTLRLVP